MEEVEEFKYFGKVLCNYGEIEGETRERAVKGRCIIGSLARIMRTRNVSIQVKRFKEQNSPANIYDVWIRDLDTYFPVNLTLVSWSGILWVYERAA